LDRLIADMADAEGTTLQAALRDVLTDLRHLAITKNLDFEAAERAAAEVFIEETRH
jgi:phosphoribosylformylglycinamidine (FGAM) synthase PurS component